MFLAIPLCASPPDSARSELSWVASSERRPALWFALRSCECQTGAVAGQRAVEGSADSITAVIDHLAARLLVAEAGEDERLGTRMTTALPALRAVPKWPNCIPAKRLLGFRTPIRDALSRDSTFALAALRLAVAADHLGDAVRLRRGIGLAWAFRGELVQRDQALLRGYAGTRFPAPSVAREQLDDWHRLADLAPTAAESWFAFGSRLFHDGATAGVPRRVIGRGRPCGGHLGGNTGSVAAARLLTHLTSETEPEGLRRPWLGGSRSTTLSIHSRRSFGGVLRPLQSDSAVIRSFHGQMESLGPANLREIAMASQFDAIDLQGWCSCARHTAETQRYAIAFGGSAGRRRMRWR